MNSSNVLRGLLTTPAGLAYLATRNNTNPWSYARHLQLLNKHLVEIAAGRTKRLMVFMPPRHGKSLLVSQYFAAWYLLTHPEHRVILASYGADYASTWGAKARDTFAEFGSFAGLRLAQSSLAADHWNIEKHRGGMDTAGVGGSLTGRGADLLLLDDVLKNWDESQSATIREKTWQWFTSTAYTRLSSNGKIVLVMTRWNHDDLAGRILEQMKHGGEEWTVLSLPAIAEEHDDLGRLPGEALWPEQFSLEHLEQRKIVLGGQQFISLYQQRPSPIAGATFKRPWFNQRYRELPQLDTTVMAIDSAFKTGVNSDYSVISTWGKDSTNYFAINVWRDRVEFPDLVRAITDQYNRFRPNAILIEDAASGQSAIQQLRRTTNLPIIPVKAKGSKQSRAEVISPLWEAGKVYLPESAVWLDDFIEESIQFPNGEHDDMVDAMVHALIRLSARQEVGSIPSVWDLDVSLAEPNIWDAESPDDIPLIPLWS